MTIRLYVCPADLLQRGVGTIKGVPVSLTGYYPRIVQYAVRYRSVVASKGDTDGSPALFWILAVGQASDWAGADADAEMRLIAEFPAAVTSYQQSKTFLKSTAVGDLSAVVRTRLQDVFDAIGVNRGDFTLATPLWVVWKRLASSQQEADDNFGGEVFE